MQERLSDLSVWKSLELVRFCRV